jgi:RNA polymerase sigma factor (sigma-70 family)
MSGSVLSAGVRQLRGLAAGRRGLDESDEQLLQAFTADRDEPAFAALVRRHGPMVLAVCRRVLGHQQDAEDAFQATFLVLARGANSLRKKTALAGFLHGTAYRIALGAKRAVARRRKHEAQAPVRPPSNPSNELLWREVQALLDEEIARLPDPYRSVFVLCCLENVGLAGAARRLGLKEGTVSSRLTHARQRLRRRLSRRGVELTVLLAATALATPSSSALPAVLLTATTSATVSPTVAALMHAGLNGLSAGKVKMAAAILLVGSLLTGAGLCVYRTSAPITQGLPGEPSPVPKRNDNPQTAPPKHEAAKTVEIQGRVFDPDGKPKAGAKLFFLGEREKLRQLGVSDGDGRFTVAVPKEAKQNFLDFLIARSDGTGLDFLALDSLKRGKQVELRLVKDNAIRGRVVNTEGKPVRGVRVAAGQIETYLNNSLDSFMAAWMNLFAGGKGLGTQKQLWSDPGVLFATTTDAEGRFTLHGIGGERTVHLHFSGGGIADTSAWVVNRTGFDPKPYNQANMERDREGRRSVNWRWFLLSGPDFSVVVESEKVIRGVVTDVDTGKGRPGLEVLLTHYKDEPLEDGPKAKTDAQGRYEIHGARKAKSYLLAVPCDPATATMSSQVWVEGTDGYRPVTANIRVKKGVLLTGKILDGTTGESLPGFVMAAVLRGNPFVKDYPTFKPLFMAQCDSSGRTDADGTFRLVIIPGPLLLMANEASRSSTVFKWTGADPKYPQYFTENGRGFYGANLMAPLQGAWNKVLEIKPGVALVKQDIILERQEALTVVRVQDAEGRPVNGAWGAANGRDIWIPYGQGENGSCSVYGEPAGKPQLLVFYEPERKLAGTLTMKGDEKQPLVVKLGPAGAIKGRLLDADGKPLAGMVVDLRYSENAAEKIHERAHEGKEIVSDANGAFAFDEVIPGWEFDLSFRRATRKFEREAKPAGATIQIKPGESRDLGAIRLKRIPEKAGD